MSDLNSLVTRIKAILDEPDEITVDRAKKALAALGEPEEPLMPEPEWLVKATAAEFHKHLCRCGTGCINCRGTGYNQTPCAVCDKNGIAWGNVVTKGFPGIPDGTKVNLKDSI